MGVVSVDWEKLLEQYYRDGMKDEELLPEAIASMESFFELESLDKLTKRSAVYAVAYLALKREARINKAQYKNGLDDFTTDEILEEIKRRTLT